MLRSRHRLSYLSQQPAHPCALSRALHEHGGKPGVVAPELRAFLLAGGW